MDTTGCTHLRHPVVVSSAEATDKAIVVEMTDLLAEQKISMKKKGAAATKAMTSTTAIRRPKR